jgi:hypothetical protein
MLDATTESSPCDSRHGNRVPQHAERLPDRISEQVAVGKAGDARGLAHGDYALAVGMDRAHRLERAFVHAGAGADGRAEPFLGEAEGSRLAIGGARRGGAVAGHDLGGVDGRQVGISPETRPACSFATASIGARSSCLEINGGVDRRKDRRSPTPLKPSDQKTSAAAGDGIGFFNL